ncbi:hypothetical protein CASFOL_013093 [Castilleja foliolosa]|uniref:Thioredoxin domain-containing protein n=1 Tax=Castilleja foliolosa TaxID=1961234 RepID=A0ABD3DJ37_9LAMI
MDAGKIEELKTLVERCKQNPSLLHTPSLAFFKDFLQSMGAQIPETEKSTSKNLVQRNDDEDIVESDVELDISDVVEPDNGPPQKMGDPSVEVTEKDQEVAQLLKAGAMDAISHGLFDDAIDYLTKAIILNPKSAILYENRADVFVKVKKPNAAIRDADAALQIYRYSAKGYKARGMARAMLGLWGEAFPDLSMALMLGFDEEISSVFKKVESNAKKIDEHHRKYECLRKEKELRKNDLKRQKLQESEAASFLEDGQVIGIRSFNELKGKLNAAEKTSQLAVLYFTATWCGPCRYIGPVISGFAENYRKVVFIKVDIDEAPLAAAEYRPTLLPSFFFVRNGREIDNYFGVDMDLLEAKLAQHAV